MIGVRYAALRTQGVIEEGQVGETAILDYPIHQDKLIKLLVGTPLPPALPPFLLRSLPPSCCPFIG